MRKRRWPKRLISGILAAGMVFSGLPVLSPPKAALAAPGGSSREVITEIDFSDMTGLDALPAGWRIDTQAGTKELVEAGGGLDGKALKLSKPNSGNTIQLINDALGITESEFPYISVETTIKLSSESHANQWSIPYLQNGSTTAYTLLAEGDWSSYKSHVANGSTKKVSGATALDRWQNIRMDIDLKNNTFRVSVDGAYTLYDEKARNAVDRLSTIKFYADTHNTGTVYIQSVKITGQKDRDQSAAFYISNSGDDNADGTTPETAWQTLGRVNQERFVPGDKILFERGGEWENETLFPHGSGSDEAYITIASYGTADQAMPKISTNGMAADALCFYNQEYWEISELDISNTVPGFSQTTNNGEAPDYNNAARNNADGALLGDYRGIHIAGRDVRYLKGYHIHDVKVHDVTGVVGWIGNTGLTDAGIVNNMGLDGSKRTGGLLIECLAPSGNTPTQFSDITIEKSEFINNSFAGITIKQWHGSGGQDSSNPGWDARNNNSGAPDYASSNWYPHSNIVVQDNLVNQGASAYACNGIYLTSVRDSIIQRNVVEHIGTCGIELYFADNVVIQYNEVSDIIHKGGGADDNAIDPDWRVSNALIQYNYIHDAGEGFLLCGMRFNTGIIRYNLVQDCRTSYVHYSMGGGHFQLYNNVFYNSPDGNGTTNFDPWGGGSASYMNNIFYDGKGRNFNFSGGSSFAFNNNAYFGTAPTSKDSNPIILTEDPFVGEAPSMDRKGSFASGVLLEANGLQLKADSPLIGAGTTVDPKGYTIDEGLRTRGSIFNFTPLAAAIEDYQWDGDAFIDRTAYPVFEQTGDAATFGTPKNQNPADETAPSIGLFEVSIPADQVVLRGEVTDGFNPVAGVQVKVAVNGETVTAVTDESGRYSITEGLQIGEAEITVSHSDFDDKVETVTLEGGKVTVMNFAFPLPEVPGALPYELIDEDFEAQTDPENFGFTAGAVIEGGKLVLSKQGTMGNASAAVMYFDESISTQKEIDLTFNYRCTDGNKQGLQFRDIDGNLLFALCAAVSNSSQIRTSVVGGAVADANAASSAEPTWSSLPIDRNTTYTVHLHADFEAGEVSYSLAKADGTIVAQEMNKPTAAENFGKMVVCSWWDSKAQYLDDFHLTGAEDPALVNAVYYTNKIDVTTPPVQVEYEIDETFNPAGMVVTLYEESLTVGAAPRTRELSAGEYDYSYDFSEAGQRLVTITYQGTNDQNGAEEFTDSFTVTVLEQEPEEPEYYCYRIQAEKLVNTVYQVDDEFDRDTIKVTAYERASASNASPQERSRVLAADEYDVTYDFSEAGDAEVLISYYEDDAEDVEQEFTASIQVRVVAAQEQFYTTGIQIKRIPDKTDYRVGETLDPTGLVVAANEKASPSNAVREVLLAEDEYELADYMFSSPGEKRIDVFYEAEQQNGQTRRFNAFFEVTVEEDEPVEEATLTSIRITANPLKMEYRIGEAFDPAGMQVTAYYSDNTRRVVDDYIVADYDFSTAGQRIVAINYQGKTAVLTVTIKADNEGGSEQEKVLTGIEITRKPNKTTYYPNEMFDPSGMVVMARYSDRTTAEITDYEVEEKKFLSHGKQQITVSYQGRQAMVEVVVIRRNSGSGSSSSGGSGGSYSYRRAAGKSPEKTNPSLTGPNGNTAGEWKADTAGWRYELSAGEYAKNQWVQIKNRWHFFNPDGYMATGWQQVNGVWYYLHESGEMAEGTWVLGQEGWYYLNADGAMAVNTVTPDGFKVDMAGKWISE